MSIKRFDPELGWITEEPDGNYILFKDHENEIKESKSKIEKLEVELSDMNRKYSDLESFAEMRDAGHDDLRTRLNAANAEITRLKKQLGSRH